MKKIIILSTLFTIHLSLFTAKGQVSSCATAVEFCTSSNYFFSNTTGVGSIGGGGVYGCVTLTPNPKWFYMQVTTPGNIIFTINQTNLSGVPIDVDYVCWGPFATPADGCTVIGDTALGAAAITSCSYSGSASETCTINGALAGQYYILLCTNYSNQTGNITFVLNASSTGTSLCTSTCSVSSVTAVPSVCSAPSNTYILSGQINFASPPSTGLLTVTTTGGGSQTFTPPFNNPITYSIPNLQSTGAACTVHASFSDDGTCFQTATYTAPIPCIPCTVAISNSGPTCVGDTLNLTASTVTGATYAWSGPNGFTSSLQSPSILSVTMAAAGTYTVVVTVTANGMSCTQSTNVIINSAPVVVVNSPTICSGQTISLTANTPITGGSFLWTQPTDTTNSISITPLSDTICFVSYTLEGCTNIGHDTANVTVVPRPSVSCNSDTICLGQSAVLSANPSPAGGTFYWAAGGQTTQTITVAPVATTGYVVFYTLNGCANTVGGIVTVVPFPTTPVISQFGTMLASSASTGNQWYLNDTLITGANGQTYNVTQNGEYYVINTNNGCPSDTSLHVTFLDIGIAETSNSNLVQIYPNPANEFISLIVNSNLIGTIYTITDVYGRVIMSDKIKTFNTSINISNYARGIYFIELITSQTHLIRKIIKE